MFFFKKSKVGWWQTGMKPTNLRFPLPHSQACHNNRQILEEKHQGAIAPFNISGAGVKV